MHMSAIEKNFCCQICDPVEQLTTPFSVPLSENQTSTLV